MNEAARTRWDDVRHEPQAGSPARGSASAVADPLAELARLVGQDDPFRAVFRPGADRTPQPALDRPSARGDRGHGHPQDAFHAVEPETQTERPGYDGYDHDQDYDRSAEWHGADPYADQHGQPDQHGHPDHPDHQGRHWHAEGEDSGEHRDGASYVAHREADGHPDAVAGEGYDDDAGFDDGHLAAEAAAAIHPDMWARQGDGSVPAAPAIDHGVAPPELGGRGQTSARRPLAVLAAVLVLTGGGLAASFLVKGPSSPGAGTASSGRVAPTIMAAAGPTKVKAEDAGATAPEDQDAALLNKNGNLSAGPVRIVSSQEQPADLTQLPRSSDLAEGARPLPPAAPSPFPEPKKVKTFVVHPDGTMLSADGAPAGSAGSLGSAGSGSAGVPSAATPRAAAHGGATPATTPNSAAPPDAIAALAATPPDAVGTAAAGTAATGTAATGTATKAKAARQPASPGVRVAAAKPNDAAEAPNAPGGSFGVQLASSPVEADANAAFAKLKKKYPAQLGSLSASVHRAETGDKPIYRLRVGSMSQDEANTLCSQLKGAGGSCFVVHN